MKEDRDYTRYPPPISMNAVGWLCLGILIGIFLGLICIRISE